MQALSYGARMNGKRVILGGLDKNVQVSWAFIHKFFNSSVLYFLGGISLIVPLPFFSPLLWLVLRCSVPFCSALLHSMLPWFVLFSFILFYHGLFCPVLFSSYLFCRPSLLTLPHPGFSLQSCPSFTLICPVLLALSLLHSLYVIRLVTEPLISPCLLSLPPSYNSLPLIPRSLLPCLSSLLITYIF